MSILELKQAVSRLSKHERAELQTYLVQLRHKTPQQKRKPTKRVRAVKAGKSVVDEKKLPLPAAHKRVIEARVEEYRSGKTKPISHKELMSRLRAS